MVKSRLKLPSPEEIHGDTRLAAQVIGVLYVAGAVLAAVSLLLPVPAEINSRAILATAAAGALVATVLFASADRITPSLLQVTIGLGSLLISLCIDFAGQSSAYAAMFIWVVLVSAFFFPGRRTAAQLVWLLSVYAAALYSIPSSGYSPLTRLLLSGIAFGTAAAVVSWLSQATRRHVEVSESRARTDPLTGIANRRWLDKELARELAWARRHQAPLCAAIIDLDGFKRYNDEHGHLAGDNLLVSAVKAWKSVVRPSDFLARVGGDEFMLLMPDCHAESGASILERLRQATPEAASCSTGLAIWDERESALALFARADAALYEAKRTGRHAIPAGTAGP
jgi:diguanylate cyclase (GGDEF)-like protein